MSRKIVDLLTVPEPGEVAGRIRAERERLALSQSEAARLMGTPRGSYRQLEVSANPTLGTVFALVAKLGMDPKRIVPELFR